MEELTWKNAEGISLHAVHWPVDGPKAVIALVHGQGEHIGRYHHLARWFNARGVAVLGFDQQGHGKSGGKRGHVAHLDAYLDDIGLLLGEARRLYPGLPLFLYGHSMGGNLTLNYVLRRRPDGLAGLIATGPWIRLAFEAPALKVAAGRLLRRLMPTISLPTGLAAHFLSHDTAVVQAYKTDPFVHDQLSAAAGLALLEGGAWLDGYAGNSPVPLLLMHGGADKITSAPATRALAGRLQGDVTFREWADLYHEIHNEKEQEQVFDFTIAWMERDSRQWAVGSRQ